MCDMSISRCVTRSLSRSCHRLLLSSQNMYCYVNDVCLPFVNSGVVPVCKLLSGDSAALEMLLCGFVTPQSNSCVCTIWHAMQGRDLMQE
jgi:hypothetical protein